MIDIGIGIWLMWRNGKEAALKGHSKSLWWLISVCLWWGGEIVGVIVAMLLNPRANRDLLSLSLFSYPFMIIGGIIAWQLVKRLPQPAWMSAAATFRPTHSAPPGGLPVTDAPDPTRPVMGVIPEFQPLMIMAVAGDWAQVRAYNGWTGWANGRVLVGPSLGLGGPTSSQPPA